MQVSKKYYIVINIIFIILVSIAFYSNQYNINFKIDKIFNESKSYIGFLFLFFIIYSIYLFFTKNAKVFLVILITTILAILLTNLTTNNYTSKIINKFVSDVSCKSCNLIKLNNGDVIEGFIINENEEHISIFTKNNITTLFKININSISKKI